MSPATRRVRPLGNRVLVKPYLPSGEVKKGSLYLPASALSSPQEGTVVGVGSKVSADVSLGDRILFGKYVGSEVYIEGVLYLIVREPNVLAVL